MKKTIFVLCMVSVLLGCASQQETQRAILERDIPEWVINPPVDIGVIYGIGSSKSYDGFYEENARIAEEKAYLSAAFEFYMGSHVGELTAILAMMEKNTLGEADDFAWMLNDGIRTVKLTWEVSYMKVVKLEKSPDGTWWCLAAFEWQKWGEDFKKRLEEGRMGAFSRFRLWF